MKSKSVKLLILALAALFASDIAVRAQSKAAEKPEKEKPAERVISADLVPSGSVVVKRAITNSKTSELRGATFEGKGELELKTPKERRDGQDAVTYYSVRYKPSIGKNGEYSTLDLDGAVIGARRSETMPGVCELVVLPGGKENRKPAEWVGTGVLIPFKSAESIAAPVDLLAVTDTSKGTWDLYANRRLVASGLPYTKKSGKILAKSSSDSETRIDSLRVTDYNPLAQLRSKEK